MASLIVSYPNGKEETHDLSGGKITLGSLPDNDIQINDASVASYQAEFTLRGSKYRLTDLDSENGTYINWERIKRVDLTPGAEIRFGNVHAIYSTAAGGDIQRIPETGTALEAPAVESRRPADFFNASPFKSKGKTRDKAGGRIIGFAVLSMIVFLVALVMILMLEAPR